MYVERSTSHSENNRILNDAVCVSSGERARQAMNAQRRSQPASRPLERPLLVGASNKQEDVPK